MQVLFRTLRGRLRALVHRNVVVDEIREEMRAHVEQRADDLERQGIPREEAHKEAVRRFGNMPRLLDEGYDIRGGGVLESVVSDARLAARRLRHRRIYSTAAIVTLAFGIGLTSTLFSIVDAAWLRPLPFPSPDRIVEISFDTSVAGQPPELMQPSLDEVRTLRVAAHVFEAVGQWHGWEQRQILDDGEPERVKVLKMSEGYVDVYGIAPVVGRLFAESDGRVGAPAVVILGHAYWKRRYAGDPGVVGRTMLLDNVTTTVVGVLPASFHRMVQVWQPERLDAAAAGRRGSGASVYGRLRPGVSLADAERAVGEAMGGGVERVVLRSVFEQEVASARDSVLVVVVAVLVLVALVCVNVGSLVFADGTRRRQELAVRASLGAGRRRLVRQLITEALVLGTIACAVGLLLAWLSLNALVGVLPLDLSPHASPSLNARVLMATVAAGFATIMIVSLWPAWRTTRSSLHDVQTGAAGRSDASRRWAGSAVIASEVALAVMLLIGGGLLIRSLDRLLASDLGFDPHAIQTLEVTPLDAAPVVWAQYYPALLAALRTVPGVEAAGAVDSMPLASTGMAFGFVRRDAETVGANASGVSPGYLEALGLHPIQGRTFAESDRGQRVVVIDDTAARQLFPEGPAVGRTLFVPQPVTVIGVVPNIREGGGRSRDQDPTVYSWLVPDPGLPPTVVIRPVPGQWPSSGALRQAALSVGYRAFVERIRPGADLLSENVATPRRRTVLLGLLAAVGLLLALLGTAGVTAYAVGRRTQEIGIRMAFGASPATVVRGITFEAARPIGIGVLLGFGGAYLTTETLRGFLFQTPPFDGPTLGTVAITIVVATLTAAWLPARRAARVNPVEALRAE